MSRGIRLSEKHGVNPSMGVCIVCHEDDGTIILPGRLPNDAEAPRRAVWSFEPCDKCRKGVLTEGCALIEATGDERRPEPTGRVWVLRDEAIRRIVRPASLTEHIIRKRLSFIAPATVKALGLDEVR